MNTKIEITKIKASDIGMATQVLRKKYKYAKIISYIFEEDFKYIRLENRNYKNRKMIVAFIKDNFKLREEMKNENVDD